MALFINDYSEGAHPNIMAALCASNLEQTEGYGQDPYTQKATQAIKKHLNCPNCEVYFMVGGTQTNLTFISHTLRPYQAVISAHTGHIATHETGAIEATGHKVITVNSENGKLTTQMISNVLEQHNLAPHMVQPKLVYVSQPTEMGTLYSKQELQEIHNFCAKHNLFFYLDGARLSSALAAQIGSLSLSDIASLTDAFYIGGTKCGALFGEALVIINKDIAKDFDFSVKQKGAMLAKGRLLGIQFECLFTDDLYLNIGIHENKMALLLRDSLQKLNSKFLIDSLTNQQFIILPNKVIEKLRKQYGDLLWEKYDDNSSSIRLVTSWATKESDVLEFINDCANAL